MADNTTPRPWAVYSDEGSNGIDSPKYPTKAAVMIYADGDCEHHPIADCSANHTCRMDWECEANAALIVRAVNNHDRLVDALDMCRMIIKFHVKDAGACVSKDEGQTMFSALDAYNAATAALQAAKEPVE